MIRHILALAVPAALKHLLDMIQVLIDLIMVSSLGVSALAAVGLGLQFMMMLGVVMTLYSIGGNATISRLKGQGRFKRANVALYNLAWVAIILSLATTVVIYPFTTLIFDAMQHDPRVTALGVDYFGTMSLGFVAIFLDMLFFTYFSAMGNTRISFYIKSFSALVNVCLNYILIFGHFGFEAMGVKGAAIATLLATALNVLVYLFWLKRYKMYGFIRHFSMPMIKDMLRIGAPAAFERGLGMFSFLLFVAIIASYSTDALAGYQIGLRIEGLAFMPGFGFSVAAMTLIGQQLGAKNPEMAEKMVLVTAYIAAGFMGFLGIFMVLFPEWLIHFFTQDETAIQQAALYLRFVGIAQVPLALMFVLSAALRGAGAVKTTMKISLVTLWSIRVLPSWVASIISPDIIWVYIVMTIETFVKGGIFFIVFKKGRWKSIRLKV